MPAFVPCLPRRLYWVPAVRWALRTGILVLLLAMSGAAAAGGEEEGEARADGDGQQATPATGTTAPDEKLQKRSG